MLTWPQVLAWRMRRQLLDPLGDPTVEGIVDRLCGVQAQVASSAELAVRLRRRASRSGEVGEALADGTLLRTWAMRGALHLVTPELGGALLALMAAGRTWERPSWQRAYGATPAVIDRLREAVGRALEGRTLTREELVAAVAAEPGLGHLAEGLGSSWGSLLKPLAWQGVLCSGPPRATRATFMRPVDATPRWRGLLPVEEAVRRAVPAYLSVYGPATSERFGSWVSGGFFGTRALRHWFASLGDRLATVEVETEPMSILAEDIDELAATVPSTAVRLLPGFDQAVLGPGTNDGHVVPAARRSAVSRQAGWIAPVVLAGGSVAATWALDGDRVRVGWFAEAGPPPHGALEAEVERLAGVLARPLELAVTIS